MRVKGRVESGKGEAAFFTSLDWVTRQLESQAGFAPFPGTLNVRVDPRDLTRVDELFATKDFEIVPEDPRFCSAFFKRVWLDGVAAVAVFPSEDVHAYGKDVIEIIAHCHLKRALDLNDGDEVTISDARGTDSREGSGEA